ncbi:Venom allergen 3 [Amphibalanus amphitrite]|uniref:Venom allergen 3 n=1 Tax=Amphibalanus amphitrite TaxID=1232801 RepID=A0A6A4VUM9_AMPAM|nr:Venom allergen 3 [Amphibalanus amphitrite]
MPDLQWDSELAAIAQRWANQCKENHDQCRNVKRFQVGQNAAWTWGSPLDWTKGAMQGWFQEELPYFRQNDLVFRSGRDPGSGKQIGHLTQIIWADTKYIGCGYSASPEGSWVKRSYICNYGPAAIAQRWADQCKEDHDQCRNVKRFQVGQNAAWTWGSPLDWTKGALQGWPSATF